MEGKQGEKGDTGGKEEEGGSVEGLQIETRNCPTLMVVMGNLEKNSLGEME